MKLLATIICGFAALSASMQAQTVLFESDTANHVFYRIPALLAHGKTLIYFTDDRSGVGRHRLGGKHQHRGTTQHRLRQHLATCRADGG